MPHRHPDLWVYPGLFGTAVKILLDYHPVKSRVESIFRLLTYVGGGLLSAYICASLLYSFEYSPELVGAGSAVAGFFGLTVLDWFEKTGLSLLSEILRLKLGLKKRPPNTPNPNYDNDNSNDHDSDREGDR